jgi:hypothetical protein
MGVAKQMGLADWTMIARTYGLWLPDADPDTGPRVGQLFDSETRKRQANHGQWAVTFGRNTQAHGMRVTVSRRSTSSLAKKYSSSESC